VRGQLVCRPCAGQSISTESGPVPTEDVHQLTDPTICADCRKDNGDAPLRRLFGRHLCPGCLRHRRGIQFPLWARLAFFACIILGGWGFSHSIRVARAIRYYSTGVAAFRSDNYSAAATNLETARKLMSDEKVFEDLESFYKGHACLENGNPKEAAHWFQASLRLDPESEPTQTWLLVAERRAAFDAEHWDTYLQKSKALLELKGKSAQTLLALAPAWACKFVTTGNGEYRRQALACLQEARTAPGVDPDDWIIEAWVNQMLEKHTIISLIQFRFSVGRVDDEHGDFG